MAADYPRRYVGREENAQILGRGYTAQTETLDTTTAISFRKSVVDVLNLSFNKRPGATVFSSYDDKGFRIITDFYQLDNPHDFPFDFSDLEHTKDQYFMQAIAQFLVLTFNQMIVDMSEADRPEKAAAPVDDPPPVNAAANAAADAAADAAAKAIKAKVLQDCQDSVAMALGITLNPATKVAASPEVIAAHFELIKAIVNVLNNIPDGAAAGINQPVVSVTDAPVIITITQQSPSEGPGIAGPANKSSDPIDINMTNVTDINDIVIYNANIAAALLAARKNSIRGKQQLDSLKNVLDGYSLVRGTIVPEVGEEEEEEDTEPPIKPGPEPALPGATAGSFNIRLRMKLPAPA